MAKKLDQYKNALDGLWELLEQLAARSAHKKSFDTFATMVNAADDFVTRYLRAEKELRQVARRGTYEDAEREKELLAEERMLVGSLSLRFKGVINRCKYMERQGYITRDQCEAIADRLWSMGEALHDLGVPLSDRMPAPVQKRYRFTAPENEQPPLYRHDALKRTLDLQPAYYGFFNDLKPLMGLAERER